MKTHQKVFYALSRGALLTAAVTVAVLFRAFANMEDRQDLGCPLVL